MNVQNVSTVPKHIDDFIKGNQDKLNEIYDEGMEAFKEGFLSFKCAKSQNKMDVHFLHEGLAIENFQKDSWENLKKTRGSKRLFMIEDLDHNSMFIVYI